MSEQFSFTKFVMSFFEWLPWLKTLRHFIGIGIIIAIIFGVYTKFFKKVGEQNTQIKGNVETVNIIQKPSRFFIPFAEGTVGQDSEGGSLDFAVRVGVRVEF